MKCKHSRNASVSCVYDTNPNPLCKFAFGNKPNKRLSIVTQTHQQIFRSSRRRVHGLPQGEPKPRVQGRALQPLTQFGRARDPGLDQHRSRRRLTGSSQRRRRRRPLDIFTPSRLCCARKGGRTDRRPHLIARPPPTPALLYSVANTTGLAIRAESERHRWME